MTSRRAANQMLDWQVNLPANAVEASVHDHMITLSGNVIRKCRRVAASGAVSHLRGVTNTTSPSHRPPQASGAKAATQAPSMCNAHLDPDTITVEVNEHALNRRGHGRPWAEYREGENVAWAAVGIMSGSNDLLVIS